MVLGFAWKRENFHLSSVEKQEYQRDAPSLKRIGNAVHQLRKV